MIDFEQIGWQRISIEQDALDRAQRDLQAAGLTVRELDLAGYASEFIAFVKQSYYDGEYKFYGEQPIIVYWRRPSSILSI